MKKWLMAVVLVLGCGPTHKAKTPSAPADNSLIVKLQAREAVWLAELAAKADAQTGWLDLVDCDGTVWEGEAHAAGHPVRLEAAEYAPGEIHRRPKASGECYPKESGAWGSADVYQGYMLGMFGGGDRAALERLQAYGVAHAWVMGKPEADVRSVLSPAGAGRLGRLVAKLGGVGNDLKGVVDPCGPVLKDYEFHLQAVGVWLDGEAVGGISDLCLAALQRNGRQWPLDALQQAVLGVYDGDQGAAVSLLLDDAYVCPAYVRPVPIYCTVHKAFAARVVLQRFGGG